MVVNALMMLLGSSPLARGTLIFREIYRRVQGLIPARAGNTSGGMCNGVQLGAHPRSRGEHNAGAVAPGFLPGSSPLARGTHYIITQHDRFAGLIPARAGNTNHM